MCVKASASFSDVDKNKDRGRKREKHRHAGRESELCRETHAHRDRYEIQTYEKEK